MFYDVVCNGIKVRSHCNWYKFGEKPNKFTLNIEKNRGCQITLRNIISKNGELTDLQQVNCDIFSVYQDLFSKKCNADQKEINSLLENLIFRKLSNFQKENCKSVLSEKEIFGSIKIFPNIKSPKQDGLTKEFYYVFKNENKQPFANLMSDLNEQNA